MSPTPTPTSTIVQMLYAVPPRLSLAGLTTQLGRTLPGQPGVAGRGAAPDAGTAHLDMPACRLTLSLRRDCSRAIGACLTIGVGPRPDAPPSPLDPAEVAARQTGLARKVSTAISARFAPNQVLWHIAPTVVTAQVIEALLATLPTTLPDRKDQADAVDLTRVLARIEHALAERGAQPSMPASRQRMAGQGFAHRWQRGRMSMGPAPATPATPRRCPALPAPANSLPVLPRPDDRGRMATLRALDAVGSRCALTLTLGGRVHTMVLGGAR